MKLVTVLVALLFALGIAGESIQAQGRGNGQAKKTTTTQAAQQTTKQTTKGNTHAPTTTTQAAKPAAKADAHVAKVETKAARNETKAAHQSGTTPVTTLVTPTTPTTHTVKNPKLEARLLTLLPPGSTIQDASYGFKNWGQFVAAAHVSNNLGIPFADLKSRMTGIPPGTPPGTPVLTTPMSLGQAIQSFKGTTTTDPSTFSSTRVRSEVKKAEDAANADFRRSRERS